MANEILAQSDDVSGEYATHRREAEIEVNAAEMNQWLDSRTPAATMTGDIAPEPFPTNRVPPAQTSVPATIVRNVSEIPRQSVGGAQDFLKNVSASWQPLTDWLNENTGADLTIPMVSEPKTATGAFARPFSRFMVGFIPALKAAQTAGAGVVLSNMGAGFISDFLGSGQHEKRLADAWIAYGLPQNIVTDFLSSNPDDTLFLSKFKAAVEGALGGTAVLGGLKLADGVVKAGIALRAARAAKKGIVAEGEAQTAMQAAKQQYGELTPEQSKQILGDPSAPLVSGPDKIDEAMAKTARVSPSEIVDAGNTVRLYHGTPHEFEKFDPSKIGTGEGAQAYGYGLYFAENVDTAKGYAKKLGGHVYSVDVKKDVIEKTIDWDKSFLEQPEFVQRALNSNKVPKELREVIADKERNLSGMEIHDSINSWVDENFAHPYSGPGKPSNRDYTRPTKPAAEFLESIGIKGVSYFDRQSRGSGKGTRNIVIFDAKDIKTTPLGAESVYINFAGIDKPEHIKSVIDDLAQRFSGSVSEAQRGKITLKEQEKLADELGMTGTELLARRKGTPFSFEQAIAARKLWNASGENVIALAQKAESVNAGMLDHFAFRRALATHYAIQAEVLGGRTETARSLGSWRIPVGSGIEQSKALQELIESSGGQDLSGQMARMVLDLAQRGNKKAIAEFAKKSIGARTLDAVLDVWVNGLLTAPVTSMANIGSNVLFSGQNIIERSVAARIGAARGTADGVAPGEAIALAYGQISSMKDAFRLAARTWRTGEQPDFMAGSAGGKVDIPRPHAMSSEALDFSKNSVAGRTIDLLGNSLRLAGGQFMQAQDTWFKTILYRGEMAAQAVRKATAEGLTGDAFAARVQYLKDNPTDEMTISAVNFADYGTFTNKTGDIGRLFLQARTRFPATTLIFPFVKTPVNIFRAQLERTPLAPLVGQWREDIAAGGARADIAWARIATGTTIMMLALDYADSGFITGSGPKNIAEREAAVRQGFVPYSVRVGNRWQPIDRAGPLGGILMAAADISDALRRGEISEDEVDRWNEVVAMGITIAAKNSINRTYLQGAANFVEVMEDPDRYSEKYIAGMAGSFLPFTSLATTVEKAYDPTVRDVNDPLDAMRAKIFWLSGDLPPALTLWGDEKTSATGMGKAFDIFSPSQGRDIKPSPIDTEIMRLAPIAAQENVPGAAPSKIAKKTVFDGVQVNFKDWPKVYEEYVRLSGNKLKDPAHLGLGAKDFLNGMVTGKNVMGVVYKTKPDTMKLEYINTIIGQYRKAAQRKIMSDPKFSDFSAYVKYLKKQKQQSQMPVIGGKQIQLPEMQ